MIEKLEKILAPLADKLGRQRHLQAISDGMMMSLALIVVGSLFLIVANPPINLDLVDLNTSNIFLKALICWKQWAVANYNTITIPYTMTMGLIGMVTSFGVAYSLAQKYQMNTAINGIISMSVFLKPLYIVIILIIDEISSAINIIEFIFAPIHIIIIGPSATLGKLFKIVKYGSIILDNKLFHHSILAITIPVNIDNTKLKIVSYTVILI